MLTDQANYILDWKFDPSKNYNWSEINQKLKLIPGNSTIFPSFSFPCLFSGVVETGLFINMIWKAYFGSETGKVEIKSNPSLSS